MTTNKKAYGFSENKSKVETSETYSFMVDLETEFETYFFDTIDLSQYGIILGEHPYTVVASVARLSANNQLSAKIRVSCVVDNASNSLAMMVENLSSMFIRPFDYAVCITIIKHNI